MVRADKGRGYPERMDMTTPHQLPAPADDLRLVISDMDGTLLDAEGNLPEGIWDLLDVMSQRGIAFTPASGRQYTTLATMFAPHLDGMPVIAENGTYVVRDGREVSSSVIAPDVVRRVILAVRDLAAEGNDVGLVVARKSSALLERGDDPFVDHVATYYHAHGVVDDLTEHLDDVIKLSIYDFADASARTHPRMREVAANHQVILATPHWVDVMEPGANKGTAVARVQEALGVTPDQTAVFGDFLNDLEMMGMARYSFAMSNAHPDIIAAANHVAPSNADNGVVRAVRALLGLDPVTPEENTHA